MYKLVAIAGKLRGQEFTLEEGENLVGRDAGCSVHLPVEGISKKHLSITVTGDSCYLKDLDSANGTFLNGQMVKRATAKDGDRISMPDNILQIVYVKEKKIVIKKRVHNEEEDSEEEFISGGTPPDAPLAKLIWVVKYKLMRYLHNFNEEYEWNHLIAIIIFLFTVLNISLIIFPVMDSNKHLLIKEIAERGYHYIQELVRINTNALNEREIEKIDTEWITRKSEGTEGVTDYRLMDMEGRIIRPSTKLNEYVHDPHFVSAWELSKRRVSAYGVPIEKPFIKSISRSTVIIGKSIWAFNQASSQQEPIGVVAIKFSPATLKKHTQKISYNFLEALAKVGVASAILFAIFYFLTIRPLEELRFQFEEGLRGGRKDIKSKYLFSELGQLKNSINTSLQRIRELSNEEGDEFTEEEDDEKYVNSLYEFMQGASGPVLILDSQKNLAHINLEAEDLCGIRESASKGSNILDVSREKGFAATLTELCDNSANNDGTHQGGEYELTGVAYKINVASLMGKDGFAKAFYVTFVKDD